MKTLVKTGKNKKPAAVNYHREAAQCCAKQSKIEAGCHD
jgi:hypothetical protein